MKKGELNPVLANKKFLMAITTLIGTIVGAGMLGIPFVISQVGFVYGSFLIIVLGLAFLMLNLFLGEIVLRTKKPHQVTGYAEKYLRKTGKRFMMVPLLINGYGALIAYLIGEGATLHSIFGWGEPLYYTLIFFVVTFIIISRGVKATGTMELILISLLFVVVGIIGLLSYDKIQLTNLLGIDTTIFMNLAGSLFGSGFMAFLGSIKNVLFSNIGIFIAPYGVILFALMGSPAIPEIRQIFDKDRKKMKKAIIFGSLTPILLYIIFTFIVVGSIGFQNFSLLEANQRIATVALSIYTNPILGLFANLLAVLAMFTSFLTLGLALVDMYHLDYNLKRTYALALAFLVPLIIVLFDVTSFIAILGLTGAFAGGLDAILVILMYWKVKRLGERKPEYQMGKHKILGIVLILLFALGILSQFL